MRSMTDRQGEASLQKQKDIEQKSAPAREECENGFALLSKYRAAVMGFAALWILLFHTWRNVFGECRYPIVAETEEFIRRIGFCGADIFLLLSGLGLTFSIGKGSIRSFYYRRIRRIVLPFLFMAVLTGVWARWPLAEFCKNITGYNFYTRNIYSFLWFVPMITTFYLLFPWYYKRFCKSSRPILFFACSLELWLMLSLFLRDTMRGDLYGFTNRIPVFLTGVCLGWVMQNKKTAFTKTTWAAVAVTFLLGLYLSYLTNYKDMYLLVPISNCCVPNILISVSLPFLLARFLSRAGKAGPFQTAGAGLCKILMFFGRFSLESYCIQEWLCGRIAGEMLKKPYPDLWINLTVILCVTAAAYAAYLAFGQFWKSVDRRLGRQR